MSFVSRQLPGRTNLIRYAGCLVKPWRQVRLSVLRAGASSRQFGIYLGGKAKLSTPLSIRVGFRLPISVTTK